MLKILLVTDPGTFDKNLLNDLHAKFPGQIIANVEPGQSALDLISSRKPDLIITDRQVGLLLQTAQIKSAIQPRLSVMASTHQGIQLVAVSDIAFFQAEDKYVTAHHAHGELLIEDSIASLEEEFKQTFVRIHRKTLVAVAQIEGLFKTEDGKHWVKLRKVKDHIPVSRRQLPKVRARLLSK